MKTRKFLEVTLPLIGDIETGGVLAFWRPDSLCDIFRGSRQPVEGRRLLTRSRRSKITRHRLCGTRRGNVLLRRSDFIYTAAESYLRACPHHLDLSPRSEECRDHELAWQDHRALDLTVMGRMVLLQALCWMILAWMHETRHDLRLACHSRRLEVAYSVRFLAMLW